MTVSPSGVAFTLNLSDKVQATLTRSDDPARLLSTYVSRELKRAGLSGMAFAFGFDLSNEQKLHVHGFAHCPDHHRPAFKDALSRAGGAVPAGQRARQVKLDNLSAAWGWIGYFRKASQAVTAWFGKDVQPFMSRLMTQIGSAYAERLQAITDARAAREAEHHPVAEDATPEATTAAPEAATATTDQTPVVVHGAAAITTFLTAFATPPATGLAPPRPPARIDRILARAGPRRRRSAPATAPLWAPPLRANFPLGQSP